MALILNIDTSSYNSSIALSNDNKIIAFSETDSRNHTQVLLTGIKLLLNNSGHTLNDLSAIAVNIGPGSFTGLRVGLATAKGLCYSSKLPIIPINGLTAAANYAITANKNMSGAYVVIQNNYRDGWYYAAYDENLNDILPPGSTNNIDDILSGICRAPVFVYGDAADIGKNIKLKENVIFLQHVKLTANHLAPIASNFMIKGTDFNLLSTQLLYINSIF